MISIPPIRASILLVACSLLAGGARAEDRPPAAAHDLLLDTLISEALQNNPALREAEALVETAAARAGQARRLPPPSVGVRYTNEGLPPSLGLEPMSQLTLVWQQTLPAGRGLRGDILRRDETRARKSQARVELSLVAAVRRAYVALLLAREILSTLDGHRRVLDEFEDATRSRSTSGFVVWEQERLRTEIERGRLERQRLEHEAEVEARIAEINLLTSRPTGQALETTAALALHPVESLPLVLERALRVSPERHASEIAVERARLALALARRTGRPTVVIEGGYSHRGGLDPLWQAGLGFDLPFLGTRDREARLEAEACLKAAQQAAEWAARQVRSQAEQRFHRLQAAAAGAAVYRDRILPAGERSVELALSSYKIGWLPVLSVLDIVSGYYADRTAYLRQIATHESLRADLEEWLPDAGAAHGMSSPSEDVSTRIFVPPAMSH